jgi:hypothetical protein
MDVAASDVRGAGASCAEVLLEHVARQQQLQQRHTPLTVQAGAIAHTIMVVNSYCKHLCCEIHTCGNAEVASDQSAAAAAAAAAG